MTLASSEFLDLQSALAGEYSLERELGRGAMGGLLRLPAGVVDLAPLTTLLDAARRVGDDAVRLADAQREVGESLCLDQRANAVATPA